MKNLAKLAIFFSLTFVIIFLAAAGIRYLALQVEWAKSLPPKPETSLTLFIAAAHWALSLTLFSSILVTMNYIVRRGHFAPLALLCVTILSQVFCFVISSSLEQWKSVPPAQTPGVSLGGNGLILSTAINRNDTAIVLLRGTADPLGPRVAAVPGQPLVFHETANANFELPPVPFGDDTPWFLKSLSIDIRINSEILRQKFTEDPFLYLIYTVPLIMLLCSLGFAIKFSVWPLANLFLATLAFRGILALQTFFIAPEMQEIIASFLDNEIPAEFALPLLFFGFSVLVSVYSFLVFILKRRKDDEY